MLLSSFYIKISSKVMSLSDKFIANMFFPHQKQINVLERLLILHFKVDGFSVCFGHTHMCEVTEVGLL